MAGEKVTTPSVPLGVRSFSGGLNSTGNPLNLPDNESPDCLNVDFDKFGSVLKRNGYAQLNTVAFNSGATWTSIYQFRKSDLSSFLIGTCGNKFGTWSSLTGSPTDSTGSVTITAGNNNLWQWITFLDTAVGTNNVDPPIQWTGSSTATAASMPTNVTAAQYITVYQNYIFIANVVLSGTRFASRIYWSDLRALTFTAANFVDISKDDGQNITGLGVIGDRICVFKERSIWIGVFTGDVDIPFNFVKTPSEVGCINGYSIQNANNGILFQAQDGLYFLDGYSSTKMSFRTQATFNAMNKTRFQYGASVYQYEKNKYWLANCLGSSSTANQVLTYDTFNNAFGLYSGMAPASFARVITSGEERIYFGDYAGFVYRADSGVNDTPSGTSTAINAYYYTKWFDEGDIINQKGNQEAVIYYDYNSAQLTVNWSYDFSGSDDYLISFSSSGSGMLWDAGLWDSGIWGGSGGNYRRLDIGGRGRLVRYKFSNMNLSEQFKINGLGKLVYMETNV